MSKKIQINYDNIICGICSFFSTPKMQIVFFVSYKVIMDLIYLLYIGKTGDYGIQISVIDILSSYMCVLFFSGFVCIYNANFSVSSFMLMVIYMIYFIPITTYCSMGPGSSSFLFFAIIFWVLLSVLQVKIPIITIKRREKVVSKRVIWIFFAVISCFTIYMSVKYTGFRIILNLQNVYQYRAEAANYNIPGLLLYFQSFSTILLPVLILMGFQLNNKIIILGGCFLLLLNFSFAGHKTVLFMGIFLVLGFIFWRKEMISLLLPGGCLVGIVAIMEQFFLKQGYVISYFFRRQGILLAQLSEEYYRYFTENPVDIFRSTVLGKVGFETPYSLPISKVIGNNYGTQIINCNNGFLADVWSHLGTVGILILPMIIIVCLRVFDLVTHHIDSRYYVGLAIYYVILFVNTTWSTVLLTHGFLIMCLVFFFFPKTEEQSERIK